MIAAGICVVHLQVDLPVAGLKSDQAVSVGVLVVRFDGSDKPSGLQGGEKVRLDVLFRLQRRGVFAGDL